MSVIYFLAVLAVAPWLIVVADRRFITRAFGYVRAARADRKAARTLDAMRVKGLRVNTGPIPIVKADPQPVQDETPTVVLAAEPEPQPQRLGKLTPTPEPAADTVRPYLPLSILASSADGVLAEFEAWQRQNRQQAERGRHWAPDVEDTILPGPDSPFRKGWFEAMEAAHDDAAVSA